jgi:hypothetical protein
MASDPDDVLVKLYINENPSGGSSQSKTGALLPQGFFLVEGKKIRF